MEDSTTCSLMPLTNIEKARDEISVKKFINVQLKELKPIEDRGVHVHINVMIS